jgi:hypothetical protein
LTISFVLFWMVPSSSSGNPEKRSLVLGWSLRDSGL